YAWQRERYWTEATSGVTGVTSVAVDAKAQQEESSEPHIDWRAGSEAEQRQALLQLIRTEVARVLSLPSVDDLDNA
ncbi:MULTISPECIES: hypothetical protein, partial [unclassified Serratia (in: enterobacteria)]|uniref:hypothetical protein n=1 Tax=unclassified Serratia (in: enterobacteria) TaxID=2647522 RepID=UPI00056D69AB